MLQAGETGYINDTIALHAVRVPEHCTGTGAVTLHLYAPPIRRVKLYEPDNNRVIQRKPGFYTVPPQYRKLHVPSREQTPRELEGAVGEQQGQAEAPAPHQAQSEVPQAQAGVPLGQVVPAQSLQGQVGQQCSEQAAREEAAANQWSGWVI